VRHNHTTSIALFPDECDVCLVNVATAVCDSLFQLGFINAQLLMWDIMLSKSQFAGSVSG
jgi:hypothetical protein